MTASMALRSDVWGFTALALRVGGVNLALVASLRPQHREAAYHLISDVFGFSFQFI